MVLLILYQLIFIPFVPIINCELVKILKFSKDSELQDINNKSFAGSRIEQLIIPLSILNVIKVCFITASTLEIEDEDILFEYSYNLLESVKQISLPNARNIKIDMNNLKIMYNKLKTLNFIISCISFLKIFLESNYCSTCWNSKKYFLIINRIRY